MESIKAIKKYQEFIQNNLLCWLMFSSQKSHFYWVNRLTMLQWSERTAHLTKVRSIYTSQQPGRFTLVNRQDVIHWATYRICSTGPCNGHCTLVHLSNQTCSKEGRCKLPFCWPYKLKLIPKDFTKESLQEKKRYIQTRDHFNRVQLL